MATPEQIERMMEVFRSNPLLFVEEIIHAKPTTEQRQVLEAIAKPGAHVAVRSGHGPGKSAVVSWIILWGLSCFDQIKIPVTAPKFENITKITTWPEVEKWLAKMEPQFKFRIKKTSEKISIYGREEAAYSFPLVAPADNADAMQGVHAQNVIVLVEESAGVPARVWPAIEGSLTTPGSRILMVGNPTRADGYFFDAFHTNRGEWTPLHFNGELSELTDKVLFKKWEKQYGRDSNFYRVRVLGDFPKASADQLIELAWLESAIGREAYSPMSETRAGLDVARFGDDCSAIVLCKGNEITYADKWNGNDTMQTCGKVMALRAAHPFARICVDSIGVGGGVADRLRELGVPTVDVNVSESSAHGEKFNKLRDEIWWNVREYFKDLGARIDPDLPMKDDLVGQLSITRYGFTSDGKIKIESKEQMKKRGVCSPDLADALCLAKYNGATATTAADMIASTPVEVVDSSFWGTT